MNHRPYLIGLVICLLCVCAQLAEAKGGHNYVVWTKKPIHRTGLYTSHNYFVAHGVSVNGSALYYFGDVDNEGVAFNGGFNVNNLSLGGGLQFAYNLPAGNHCNLRFGFLGGTLRGNNELKFSTLKEPRDDYRKFQSILLEPSFGVQYYPFSNAGFYLYGGVAMTASIINNYEFYYYKRVTGKSDKVRTLLQGKTFGLLPMVQLGLGYSWRLTDSWSMSAEMMIQEGLVDTHYFNLDGWPMAGGQNKDGAELGGTSLTYVNRYGQQSLHWNDGWFQIGLTVTYHWRNCEHCRLLNNYHHVRMKHR